MADVLGRFYILLSRSSGFVPPSALQNPANNSCFIRRSNDRTFMNKYINTFQHIVIFERKSCPCRDHRHFDPVLRLARRLLTVMDLKGRHSLVWYLCFFMRKSPMAAGAVVDIFPLVKPLEEAERPPRNLPLIKSSYVIP